MEKSLQSLNEAEILAHARHLLLQERYAAAETAIASRQLVTFEARLMLGVAQHGIGDHHNALATLAELHRSLSDPHALVVCTIELALACNKAGDTGRASDYCTYAEHLAVTHQLLVEIFLCRYMRAAICARQGQFSDCTDLCEALERELLEQGERRLLALTLTLHASAARSAGRYDEALSCISRASPIADALELCYRRGLLAFERAQIAYEQGAMESLEQQIREAHHWCTESGARLLAADIHMLWGSTASTSGDFNQAQNHFTQACNLYAASGYQEGCALSQVSAGLASLESGQFLAALAAFDAALGAATATSRARVWALLGRGVAYRFVGLFGHAKADLHEAMNRARHIQNHSLAAQVSVELAAVVDGVDRAALLEQAMRYVSASEPSVYEAALRRVVGVLRHAMGDNKSAATELRRSAELFGASGHRIESAVSSLLSFELGFGSAPSAHTLDTLEPVLCGFPDYMARLEIVRAQLCASDNPHNARQLVTNAIERIGITVGGYLDPILAGRISATRDRHFAAAAQLAHGLGDGRLVLRAVELRRAPWLRVIDSRLSVSGSVDDGLDFADYDRHHAQIAELRRRFRQAVERQLPDSAIALDELSQAAARAQQAILAFEAKSIRQSQHARLVEPLAPLDPDAISEALTGICGNDWSAVVLEPVDVGKRQWLRVMLKPGGVIKSQLLIASPATGLCIEQLTATDEGIRRSAYSDSRAGLKLRQQVARFLGVDDWTSPDNPNQTLLIATCEPFQRMAFGALPAQGQLLAESAVVRHVPSLSVALRRHRQAAYTVRESRALFVAPVNFAGLQPDLRYARREVDAISQGFLGAEVLGGPDAIRAALDRRAVTGQLEDFRLLHFATHAAFQTEQPRLSGIWLQDGLVPIEAILRWRLDADWVVLSCCDSARSYNPGAEDQFGLETAFLAAGARQVLSSMWRVGDAYSAHFMQDFYGAFVRHGDLAFALAQTQRLHIADSVLDWATWRVVGL